MENIDLEKLRYPIGKFILVEEYSSAYLSQQIEGIASFPGRLKKEVVHLTQEQLETPYRPNGWTIRQVIHHCTDSHMHCLIRIKFLLTEEKPVVKPYFEEYWSEMHDNKTMPILASLQILTGLHYRLEFILKSLTADDLKRSYIHPQYGKEYELREVIGLYAWHGNHHLAHIVELKKRKGWT